MCPCAARAANAARSGSAPTVRTRCSAISAYGGVRNDTTRHRDLIVATMSSAVGAHSIHIVRGGGSSTDSRMASAASSPSRSASSTTTTCQRPRDGRRAARGTSSRICLILIDNPSVTTSATSGWVPLRTSRHSAQCAAAALGAFQRRGERARHDRPSRPGRAGKSHAWVMAAPALESAVARTALASSTVRRSSGTTVCPTTASHTLTAVPAPLPVQDRRHRHARRGESRRRPVPLRRAVARARYAARTLFVEVVGLALQPVGRAGSRLRPTEAADVEHDGDVGNQPAVANATTARSRRSEAAATPGRR